MKEGARKLFNRLLPDGGISRQSGMTMLFSFLLASALWFLVIINQKNHKSSFTLPLQINNLPGNVDYLRPIPKEIEVAVEGFGVDLLVQHFRYEPDTVQLYFNTEQNFMLTRDYFSQIIQKAPKSTNIKVLSVFPDTLPVQYELRTQKKVKLYSRAEVQLAPNYQLESENTIQPDSVSISGPQSMLDTIQAWFTVADRIVVEGSRKRASIPIDTLKGIRVSPASATIELRAKLYTQKKVLMDLIITDLPEGTHVLLSQTRIQLNCLVPMEEYDRLKNSYELPVSFAQLDESIPYFIPLVENGLPGFAKIVTRSPFQVGFVVVEKISLQ